MEGNSRPLSETERLAVESGRSVLSTETVEVLEGEVNPGETALEAAIRTGGTVMTKTTIVIERG